MHHCTGGGFEGRPSRHPVGFSLLLHVGLDDRFAGRPAGSAAQREGSLSDATVPSRHLLLQEGAHERGNAAPARTGSGVWG